jgi:hypothetical protein
MTLKISFSEGNNKVNKQQYYLEKLKKIREQKNLNKEDVNLILQSMLDYFERSKDKKKNEEEMKDYYDKLIAETIPLLRNCWDRGDLYCIIENYINLFWFTIGNQYFLYKKRGLDAMKILSKDIKSLVINYLINTVLSENLFTR